MSKPVRGLKTRRFFIRLMHWEFWPMQIIYIPLYIYFVWLAVKARSLWFWSASNPGIETGGMLGESKIAIYDMIDDKLKPFTLLVNPGTKLDAVTTSLTENNIDFPVICKPDRGERGFMVTKVNNLEELGAYVSKMKVDFIVQSFCDYPMELGIYYCRYPWEETGHVFSVVKKEFLFIMGDGKSTIKQLILNKTRAVLQWEKLVERYGERMEEVLEKGVKLELEPIGNHAKGTKFMDGKDMIDDRLNKVFDEITSKMTGVYFCRYDLKTTSEEDMKNGQKISILELNGVGAEPAHIYDPNYRLFRAWGDLIRQWRMVYKISRYNRKNGVRYMTTKAVRDHLKLMKSYRILAES